MASRSLGVLTLDLVSKIGGFVGPLSQAERELDRKARAMESRAKALKGAMTGAFGTMAAGIGGFVAGVASVQAVFEGFRSAIERADQLDELSARLDISTEKLSTWGYAAQLSGTSLDDLTAALPKLSKNMVEALDSSSKSAEIFKALGVSVTDSEGKLRAVQDVLPEIADRFKSLDDATLESSLSMELFGKSGTGLLEFLNRGSDGIAELEQRARDLGIEIDGNTSTAAAAFKDRLDDLKAATSGLFTQLSAELLPELTKLVNWLTAFVRDGSNAAQIAESLGNAFEIAAKGGSFLITRLDAIGDYIESLTEGFIGLQTAANAALSGDWQGVKNAIGLLKDAAGTAKDATGQFFGLTNPKSGGRSGGGGASDPYAFLNRPAPTSAAEDAAMSRRLYGVLDGKPKSGGGRGKSGGGGKSDAQRQAESLKREVDSLNESLDRQIALYGKTSEVSKVRYEIEHGDLAKATKQEQEALLLKAQMLDLKKADDEEEKRRADLDADRAKRTADYLADIKFENDLLGKTVEEKEVLNALRYASVEATSAEGQAIRESTLAYMEHAKQVSEQISLMDEFRSGAANAISDFVTGAKSMKDAFKDFADDFARRITQMIAERWIEKLFGQQGSTGSGTSGGDWLGSLIGALFGGGKASGGPVAAGTLYRVNENRPELLSVGGRDFLMMGAQGGRVNPNPMLAGAGGTTVNQTFVVQGTPDRRTRNQMASDSGRAAARAMSRGRA